MCKAKSNSKVSDNIDSTILEVGVKALIQNSEGKYLILKRAKPYIGQKICKWDIPGGRIITREPLLKALKREIREETNLVLKSILKVLSVQDILRVPNKHTVRITYEALCNEGYIKIDPNEHSTHRWVTKEELCKLRYDLYLTPIIKMLIEKQL